LINSWRIGEKTNVKAHKGFCEIADNVYNKFFMDIIWQRNENATIWITGHSLGGGLASLFTAKMIIEKGQEWMDKHFGGLYTFGQPRCGNKDYADMFGHFERQNKVYRFVNSLDIVARLPVLSKEEKNIKKMTNEQYVHHGTLIWIDMDYNLKSVINTQISNYEGENLLLGAWEWFEKTLTGMMKLETLPRIICRFILPFSLNDHLPTDYLYALQTAAAQPSNQVNQILPILRNMIKKSKPKNPVVKENEFSFGGMLYKTRYSDLHTTSQ